MVSLIEGSPGVCSVTDFVTRVPHYPNVDSEIAPAGEESSANEPPTCVPALYLGDTGGVLGRSGGTALVPLRALHLARAV